MLACQQLVAPSPACLHCTGCTHPAHPSPAGSDESEEDSEPEEESSEDEEAPDAVPLKGTAPKPVKPRARSLVDDEAEETSEEEEEDDMKGGCCGDAGHALVWRGESCGFGGLARLIHQLIAAVAIAWFPWLQFDSAAYLLHSMMPPDSLCFLLLLPHRADDEDDDESEEEAAADKGAFGGRLVRIVGDDEESSEEGEQQCYGMLCGMHAAVAAAGLAGLVPEDVQAAVPSSACGWLLLESAAAAAAAAGHAMCTPGCKRACCLPVLPPQPLNCPRAQPNCRGGV